LSSAEVETIVRNAALAVDGAGLAIAASDRIGNPLAIYRRPGATGADVERALSLARTGAFFSSFGTPLAGALYGIENGATSARLLNAPGTGPSQGRDRRARHRRYGLGADDVTERAAAAGAIGSGFFVRTPLFDPGAVYLNGFQLPFINSDPPPAFAPQRTPAVVTRLRATACPFPMAGSPDRSRAACSPPRRRAGSCRTRLTPRVPHARPDPPSHRHARQHGDRSLTSMAASSVSSACPSRQSSRPTSPSPAA
jgi:hypothetical protein